MPNTNIRVYKQPRGYRGVWYPPKLKQSVKRVFGNWEKSIAAALEALFGKIGLTKEERCRVNAAWSESRKSGICHKKQAISHTKLDIRFGHGSAVVFFKKHPFQGKLRFLGGRWTTRFKLALLAKAKSVCDPVGMVQGRRHSRTSEESRSA